MCYGIRQCQRAFSGKFFTVTRDTHSTTYSAIILPCVSRVRCLGRLLDAEFPRPRSHVGPLCIMAFFATQPQGQQIQENTNLDHFCHFNRKSSRPILLNFDKVAKQWNNTKFRITGLSINLQNVSNGVLFFPKAAFLQHSRSKQSAKAPNSKKNCLLTFQNFCFKISPFLYVLPIIQTNIIQIFIVSNSMIW